MVDKSISYSEAFKCQVVRELEEGKFDSLSSARRAYGIGGATTLSGWVRQYGKEDLLPKKVRIQSLKERDELSEARKRIRSLEAAVADAHMDYCLEKGFLRVACEQLELDVVQFKKKHAVTLSDTRKKWRAQ